MVLEARVKSALSGDTVVLSNITNPSQERTLSLAYVSAPRLRKEGDEVSCLFLFCFSFQDHFVASLFFFPVKNSLGELQVAIGGLFLPHCPTG